MKHKEWQAPKKLLHQLPLQPLHPACISVPSVRSRSNGEQPSQYKLESHHSYKALLFLCSFFPLEALKSNSSSLRGDDTHWASMSTSMQTCCHRCRAASRDRTWCGWQPWDEDIQFWVTCDLLVSKHSKWTFLALLYFIIFFINSAILFLSYDSDCSPSD